MRKTPAELFWSHVNKDGPIVPYVGTPCWLWTASCRDDGYGQFFFNTRNQATHRVSWQLAHGTIPGDLWVLHRCDVKPCVNPTHLFLGTPQINIDDMISKGRARHVNKATGARHGSVTHPERVPRGDANGLRKHPEKVQRGSLNGQAKLTEVEIPTIRARAASGESHGRIAEDFHVSRMLVWLIVKRKAWAHVP